jgi:hypothetical protein
MGSGFIAICGRGSNACVGTPLFARRSSYTRALCEDAMAEPRNGNPMLTVIVLVVVALIAGFVFLQLNSHSNRPEASGAGGVGVDAATNTANRR